MSAVDIPGLLADRAAALRDAVAVIGNDGTGAYRSLGFAGLEAASARVAALIAEACDGRPEGRRVCWVFDNAAGLVAQVLYHAVARAGAVSVPLSAGSTAAEVERTVAAVDAAVLVAPGSLVATTPATRIAAATLEELLALAPAEDGTGPRGDRDPARAAVILFTSGTTGRSKGVVHSHASAIAAGRGWSEAFELAPGDVYQAMYPAYAGSSLHFSGLACLLAGIPYLVDETRPTAASLARVDAFGTTVYAAVPSIFQYWLQEDRASVDLGSLRLLDFGGAVMHRSTIEGLRAFVPGVDLIQTYGLTEAGPGGLYLPPAELDRKLGSIGSRATFGLSYRLDESVADGSETTDAGRVGELQFAGASIMTGYLDDPEASASVFDGEWLRTGDLVRIDDEGFVFFLDRIKDLIVRGGYNISSIEVEEALLADPGVRAVAAFGYPHDALGEVVAIAVVPEPGAFDLTRLRAHAEASLARVKVPERIVVLDALPLTAAGKVQKRALREHPGLQPFREGAVR